MVLPIPIDGQARSVWPFNHPALPVEWAGTPAREPLGEEKKRSSLPALLSSERQSHEDAGWSRRVNTLQGAIHYYDNHGSETYRQISDSVMDPFDFLGQNIDTYA